MKHSYLEVTYRKGRPLAAYYYLPRRDGDKSARTERAERGRWSISQPTAERSASRFPRRHGSTWRP